MNKYSAMWDFFGWCLYKKKLYLHFPNSAQYFKQYNEKEVSGYIPSELGKMSKSCADILKSALSAKWGEYMFQMLQKQRREGMEIQSCAAHGWVVRLSREQGADTEVISGRKHNMNQQNSRNWQYQVILWTQGRRAGWPQWQKKWKGLCCEPLAPPPNLALRTLEVELIPPISPPQTVLEDHPPEKMINHKKEMAETWIWEGGQRAAGTPAKDPSEMPSEQAPATQSF